MTVSGTLPEDVQSLFAWVACVAGGGTPRDYENTLQAAGFVDFRVEDQRDALLDLVSDVRLRLFGVEIAVGMGEVRLGDLDLEEGKRLARRAVELIEDGAVGYTLLTARKE
jgi:hypothetical protein